MSEKRSHDIAFSDNESDYDATEMLNMFNKKNRKVRKIFSPDDQNSLSEDDDIIVKDRAKEEKEKRVAEEMKVLSVLKLVKQKERLRMEMEAREKQRIIESTNQEAQDRLDAAEALIQLSEAYIKFDEHDGDDSGIIEETTASDEASTEYEFKEVYQVPEGPQQKFRLTEKKMKIMVVPYVSHY